MEWDAKVIANTPLSYCAKNFDIIPMFDDEEFADNSDNEDEMEDDVFISSDLGLFQQGRFEQLRRLVLRQFYTAETKYIIQNIGHLVNLEYLDMSFCRTGDGDCAAFADTLSRFKRLKHLNLTKNRIKDDGMVAIRQMPDLEVLTLQGIKIDDDSSSAIAGALKELRSLKELNVAHTDLRGGMVDILRSASKNLTHLNITCTAVDDAHAEQIAGILREFTDLTSLKMMNVQASAVGLNFFCRGASQHAKPDHF